MNPSITDLSRELLRHEFAFEKPFGPAATRPGITYDYSYIYFPTERFEKAVSKRYNLILGRRGSGKSSLIQRILHGTEYKYHVQLEKDELLDTIRGIAQPEEISQAPVEKLSKFWKFLFWNAIFCDLNKRFPTDVRLTKTRLYLAEHGYSSTKAVTSTIVDWLRRMSRQEGWQLSLVATLSLPLFDSSTTSFIEARDETLQVLNGAPLVILIDSQEKYTRENKRLIGGLLKAIGDFPQGHPNLFVKCFFPAEIYSFLQEASENYAKDFENVIVLHWNAKELFGMLCKRLELLRFLHDRESHYSIFHRLARVQLREIWHSAFPESIYNEVFQLEESSITYVLRHSQLLPRQVILSCNKIAENHNRSLADEKISRKAVRAGVRTAEQQICTEIFDAYKDTHPEARSLVSTYMKQCPILLNLATIDKLKSRISATEYAEYKEKPGSLLRMLCELGIVGKRLLDTDRYLRATYEYFLPEKLEINYSDELAIHPIFVESFGVPISTSVCSKAILPLGADLDEAPDF